MPANDWRQWAKERPIWIRGAVEEAFWTFVDQKWRDALNVAAAEPAGWNTGSSGTGTHGADRRGPAEAAKKLSHAAIHITAVKEKPPRQGEAVRSARSQMCSGALDNTLPGSAERSEIYEQRKGQGS
jgi:hypothetical protein